MNIPGHNHNYTTGIPFYTLKSDDGRFLSHPESIIMRNTYRTLQTEKQSSTGPILSTKTVNIATCPDWSCAWIVYSIADMRELYRILAPERERLGTRTVPSTPCTGTIIHGEHGMLQCLRVKTLTKADIATIEKMAKTTITPATDWSQAPERLRRRPHGPTLAQAARFVRR